MPKFDPITNFRFWCHKIIPLVYDESLSYYEFLCKVMQKLNEVIDLLNAHSAEIERFEQDILAQFEAFRTEIRNRITEFENLFAEPYDKTKQYVVGDITLKDGTLYRATSNTTGEFDPTKWVSIIFATDFADWRRNLDEQVLQFMTNVTNKINTWLNNIASDYDGTHQYHTGDIVKENDMLFIANTDTTGTFDVSDWDTLVLCDWLVDIIRRYDEAFDSMGEQINVLERKKAEITACNVVSKNWVSAAGVTGYTGYDGCVPSVAPTMGNVLVMVITLHVNDPTKMQDVIDCLDTISVGTDTNPVSVGEKEIQWIGESGFVIFTSITGVNLRGFLHYVNSTTYPFNYRITSYVVNGNGTSTTIPTEANIGMGFIDINNLAMYLKEEIRRTGNTADFAQEHVLALEDEFAINTAFTTPKSERYYSPNNPVLIGLGTKYETFNSSTTETIPNEGTFYVQVLDTDTVEFARLTSSLVTLFSDNVRTYIGKGTSPSEALTNAIGLRALTTGSAGNAVHIPCDFISALASDENIYILVNVNDTTLSYISGTVCVSTGEASHVDHTGTFLDVPHAEMGYNFDSRIGELELQLGGYTVMVVTQSYYDALNPPDSNTIYFTH